MRASMLLVAVLTASATLSANGLAQTPAAPPPKTITLPAALSASHDRECAAWVRGDAAGLGATYTPDVLYHPNGLVDWTSRAEAQRFMSTHFTQFRYSVCRYEPEEHMAFGEYAYERGRFYVARRTAADTADRRLVWRYIYLWKRMPDGTWLIHRAANNNHVAPPSSPPPGGGLRRLD